MLDFLQLIFELAHQAISLHQVLITVHRSGTAQTNFTQ
jgi:hypothetical protein